VDQIESKSEHFDNLFYQQSKYQNQEERDTLWNNLIKINEKLEKKALIERQEQKKALLE